MRKLKVTELNRISVSQFKEAKKLPLVLVLDNIRSVYNVGSIFRTADAFRIEKIYLCGITAKPPMPEIHKTALGAEDAVEWIYCSDTSEAISQLRQQNYWILAVEQVENSIKLNHWQLDNRPVTLVVGNEVKGVQQEIVDLCDNSLEIPQFGTKHSLNVANTAAIVMWEYFRLKTVNKL